MNTKSDSSNTQPGDEPESKPRHFIQHIIDKDLQQDLIPNKTLITRFPPEPNGYLHIGHAKSICLNFGLANEYKGLCALRFDDTNPVKEDHEFIESIKKDVKWLGFDWKDRLYNASDYFDQLYDFACTLIKKDKAYVDSLSHDDIRAYRGTLTEPGKASPYRDRSIDENLDLFTRMKAGEFKAGEHVVRAKIDMASPNITMRDPVIYRILHASHPMTGDKWCIYPMYDFTHCLSDAIEHVTHSLCTLEFEDHRPLYDWVIAHADAPATPKQIEFSRLNLEYTITSKRKLTELVKNNHVEGWDDPRMPTISGMRRRGYPPEAIVDFCQRIGITKTANTIEMSVLENSVRKQLEASALRAMAVINPIKLTIKNYPSDKTEIFDVPNHPQNPEFGSHPIPFSSTLYIEAEDFREEPEKKYFRLAPGKEVRLKYAYYVTCTEIEKDSEGNITNVICEYDPESRGGGTPDCRKVKGTIHWVSAADAVDAQVRLYDRLFNVPNPDKPNQGKPDNEKIDESIPHTFTDFINPHSLQVIQHAKITKDLLKANIQSPYQFERLGYFCFDKDHTEQSPVINRIVALRDTWSR